MTPYRVAARLNGVIVFSCIPEIYIFLYDQELGRALENNRGLRDSNSQLARQVGLDTTTLRMEVTNDAA